MGVTETLQTDVGPLPLWGWLVAGAVGVGVGVVIRRRSGGGSDAAPASVFGAATPIGLPNAAAAAVEPTGPTNNVAWRSQALTGLVANGANPTAADSALSKYLNGDDLTGDDRQLIDEALRTYNLPPSPPTIVPPEAPPQDVSVPVVPTVQESDAPIPLPTEPAVQPDRLSLIVVEAYRDILAREPDPDGLQFWREQLASGDVASGAELRAHLAASPEAQRLRL